MYEHRTSYLRTSRSLSTRSKMSSTARCITPGSDGTPDIVCVFPLDVCPYAMTVPFTPRRTARTTGRAARAYTAALPSSGANTASASQAGEGVPRGSHDGRDSATRTPSRARNDAGSGPSVGRRRTATKTRPRSASSSSASRRSDDDATARGGFDGDGAGGAVVGPAVVVVVIPTTPDADDAKIPAVPLASATARGRPATRLLDRRATRRRMDDTRAMPSRRRGFRRRACARYPARATNARSPPAASASCRGSR